MHMFPSQTISHDYKTTPVPILSRAHHGVFEKGLNVRHNYRRFMQPLPLWTTATTPGVLPKEGTQTFRQVVGFETADSSFLETSSYSDMSRWIRLWKEAEKGEPGTRGAGLVTSWHRDTSTSSRWLQRQWWLEYNSKRTGFDFYFGCFPERQE